jgi:hypothetical protein
MAYDHAAPGEATRVLYAPGAGNRAGLPQRATLQFFVCHRRAPRAGLLTCYRLPMRKHTCLLAAVAALFTTIVFVSAPQSLIAQSKTAPQFRVDPSWPLELPNNWIFGSITGVYVDSRQHVWVTHLPETLTEEELGLVQKPPF